VSVAEFLSDLRRRDVIVSADGDRIKCTAPPGALTPELRDLLRERKADVLAFLRSAQALADESPALVPLGLPDRSQAGAREAHATIYAVPGHSGDVFCYRALAARLPEHAFFALRPPGLDGPPPPLRRVEDLAAYFVEQIEGTWAGGPAIVAGFCAGGAIAAELARQLDRAGVPVAFLALIGAPHPSYFSATNRFMRRLAHHVADIGAFLRRPSLAEIARRIVARRERSDDPVLARRAEVERATTEAVAAYRPAPWDGRAVLFLPSNPWARSRYAFDLWREAMPRSEARGDGRVPADDMLLGENVQALADAFRAARDSHSAKG
jgi:thioesterase domain-containing protein